ncbi:uncharacterized protein LOC136092605 [Hydra vulgaris]|uniref:uncharacterized protein LOC136092605 n=1 Tax=Hydra vulgaris TaxID=6087 RepID=UPI0032EA6DE1
MKLDRFAMEAVRYDVSSCAAATLANALLLDYGIIKYGDLIQVIDRSKIEREKKKVMSRYGNQHDNNLSNLVSLGVNGKDDKNVLQFKDVVENREARLSRVTEKEHHLTFTNENSFKNGSYLSHKNFPSNGATGLLQSEIVYNVLKE